MIAVCSFRRMDIEDEVTKNQIRAFESFRKQFDYIICLGEYDSRIAASNTAFYPPFDLWRIVDMADICSQQRGWTCIINADIVVCNDMRAIEQKLTNNGAQAAVSWRYEFDPSIGELPPVGRKVDLGTDWFATLPQVWLDIKNKIPEQFRIGNILWDTWMLGYFRTHCHGHYYDVTPSRAIFHPKHTVRNRPHELPHHLLTNTYVKAATFPDKQIVV